MITRFHYNRVVNPKETLITGVTRNGVLLIEDGRITGRLADLRYNENVLEAFRRIDVISDELVYAGEYGMVLAPAVRITDFRFTEII